MNLTPECGILRAFVCGASRRADRGVANADAAHVSLVNALPDIVAPAHPYPLAWAGRWLLDDRPSVNVDVRRRGDAAQETAFASEERKINPPAKQVMAVQINRKRRICFVRCDIKYANATLSSRLSQGTEFPANASLTRSTREMKTGPLRPLCCGSNAC